MRDRDCVELLQWALPQLHMRWPGFRKVRRQVCKRIAQRLRKLGLKDLAAYRRYLEEHPDEWALLDSLCRISISRFYRDRQVFDVLGSDVLPDLAERAVSSGRDWLRCWSAGCASGEEVYTLKLIWDLCLSKRFPQLRFGALATDSEPHMLERARRACYEPSSLKDLPQPWISEAFAAHDEQFCLKPEFRQGVELVLQDIRDKMPRRQFDLILCRHLAFTYFDKQLQATTLARLVDRLRMGGILVTGKQEPMPRLPAELEPYGYRLGIYRKRPAESPKT